MQKINILTGLVILFLIYIAHRLDNRQNTEVKFNKYWVTDPKNEFKDIKDWILEVHSDKHKASFKICKIEITCDGGIRDLRSHAKSVVHKRNAAVIQSNKTFDRKDYTSSTMNTLLSSK